MSTIKFIGVDTKYDYKMVLPFEVKRAKPGVLKDEVLLDIWLNKIKKELKEMKYMDTITEIIPVTEHAGKWVKGEYHAHEYNAYVDGKARRLEFKDADGKLVYVTCEVVCLDKSKHVADGYWDEIGGSRVYSGTGDEFTPFEKGLGI